MGAQAQVKGFFVRSACPHMGWRSEVLRIQDCVCRFLCGIFRCLVRSVFLQNHEEGGPEGFSFGLKVLIREERLDRVGVGGSLRMMRSL